MTNMKVVVVGGGNIAFHKVQNLQRFAITPHVISPQFHPALERLAAQDKVILLRKKATFQDIQDAFLIILVTSDETVNDALAKQATAVGKLVVHASNPALGNAQVPAVHKRGKLTISVSTGGASPTLAKQLRNEIGEQFDDSYVEYMEFLAICRTRIQERFSERSERRLWLQQAIDHRYLKQPALREAFYESIK